jgi:hypothetical protein
MVLELCSESEVSKFGDVALFGNTQSRISESWQETTIGTALWVCLPLQRAIRL